MFKNKRYSSMPDLLDHDITGQHYKQASELMIIQDIDNLKYKQNVASF